MNNSSLIYNKILVLGVSFGILFWCDTALSKASNIISVTSSGKNGILETGPDQYIAFSTIDKRSLITSISVRDERGTEKKMPSTANSLKIPLTSNGYYSFTISINQGQQQSSETVTAAAIDGQRTQKKDSPFGVWNVHGDLAVAKMAGSNWIRQIFTLRDYKFSNGQVASSQQRVGNPFDDNQIGVLSFGIPNWLSISKTPQKSSLDKPADEAALENLVKQFVRDTQPFPKYFEIYNEPEHAWKGNEHELVKTLIHISRAIKSIEPGTKVLGPSFASVDIKKFNTFNDLGFFNYVDGISIHPYVKSGAPEGEFIDRIVALKSFRDRIGKSKLPIYATEFGWTTEPGAWQPPVTELRQAQYLARALTLMKVEDLSAILYFCLQYVNSTNAGEQGFSILREDGTPKPAYPAFSNTTRWLETVDSPGRHFTFPNRTHIAIFPKAARTILVGWLESDQEVARLPGAIGRWQDMMGRDVLIGEVELSESPTFAELPVDFKALEVAKPLMAVSGQELALSEGQHFVPRPIFQSGNTLRIPRGTSPGIYFWVAQTKKRWVLTPILVKG